MVLLPPPPHAVNAIARVTATQNAALCCEFFIEIPPVGLMHVCFQFSMQVKRFHPAFGKRA
jgi:hypothetical protein